MFAGDFQRKLKKLNKHLTIKSNANPKFPAGLYYEDGEDMVHICGVDYNELPKYATYEGRFIAKGGWLRPVKILIAKGIVDRRDAFKVFGPAVAETARPKDYRWQDPIEAALKEARALAKAKAQAKGKIVETQDGKAVQYMELDDLLQIARMRKQLKGRN